MNMNASITIRNTDNALDAMHRAKLALFHYNQKARATLHEPSRELIKAQRELRKALNKCSLDMVL
jgi:hypothetical protein